MQANKSTYQDGKLWKITEEGRKWLLNVLTEPSGKNRTTSRKTPIRLTNQPIPPKRANGVRVYLKLWRTEHYRVEAMLSEAKIPYTVTDTKGYKQYEAVWEGYKFKFTTLHVIAYCPDALYEFKIDGKRIRNEELEKCLAAFARFLKHCPVKMHEYEGKLWARVAYIEIAHTGSEMAEKVTERKSYVPLAYDLKTGVLCGWADRSFNFMELEFNDIPLEIKAANLVQDMKDDKWNHRLEQGRVTKAEELILKQAEVVGALIEDRQDMRMLIGEFKRQREKEQAPLPRQFNA